MSEEKERTVISLPSETKRWANSQAALNGVTLSKYLTTLINAEKNQMESEPPTPESVEVR